MPHSSLHQHTTFLMSHNLSIMRPFNTLWLFLWLLWHHLSFTKACGVCVLAVPRRLPPSAYVAAAVTRIAAADRPWLLALVAQRAWKKRYTMAFNQHPRWPFLAQTDAKDEEEAEKDDSTDSDEAPSKPPLTDAMVASIGVYKRFISPLLPPACRFLPTCSQYGVQAIEEFGPTKGAILTAWRILRCSPLGGKGYDPPKWPPVPYSYGSY